MPPKQRCLLFLLLLLNGTVWGQICGGNLGENIFDAGDFGSGTDNILVPDPGIAPGFIYETNPPPFDGFYTITNNTGAWENLYGDWLAIGDNSEDPFGYMMVVNASFNPGLFYEQRVDNLCENSVYEFSADVINLYQTGRNGIRPNISFLIDGVNFFTSGNISEDETWKTYGFTFTTGPGQTSVTLSLRNNAPGGIGNDLAIDNISFRACGPEALILPLEISNICEDGDPITLDATLNGDQYDNPAIQWQESTDGGDRWTDIPGANSFLYTHTNVATGDYYYRYLLGNGVTNLANPNCRVVSNEKVVRVVPKAYSVTDTICAGRSFAVGNRTYDQSGTYVDTLVSSIGCDSILTLRLTVVEDPGLSPDFNLTDPSCSYTTDGRVELLSVANATFPLRFTFEDSLFLGPRAFSGLPAGTYSYSVVDRYGCEAIGTVALQLPFPFVVDLGANQVAELGQTVRIPVSSTEPIAEYGWSPAELIDCLPACDQALIVPPEALTVALTATSANGCVTEDSLRISVVKNRRVYFPTGFSPNGDGVNDFFTLFGATPGVESILSLEIYNRWGVQVFSQTNAAVNDLAAGWDGNLNGTPAAIGTYAYRAEVRFLDGFTKQYRGSVVLLR
ncbi:gliding motility-associated C-terminal domain-containing protein [Lewinella sp. W8]|uniref:gliding motility-associated C-terminal domain-containing protein n=1 Tax=Lewinella sp. W8 TaxID=2528208 RepID=UPI0010672BDB|nr:gliding motility-associated C-terminal domain-containing protein [Lewinella sp. W8]MTB51783.1 T9SS type B sorting domain-containing protein [Lewinella sp. W8]